MRAQPRMVLVLLIALAAGGDALAEDVSVDALIARVPAGGERARSIRPSAFGSLSPLLQQTNVPPGVAASSLYVMFGAGSATLQEGARRTLDRLGRALVAPTLAGYRFRLEGHVDATGAEMAHGGLGLRRAAAVREYLVARFGLEERHFDLADLEATRPIAVALHGGEPLNRRVQVVNLGRGGVLAGSERR